MKLLLISNSTNPGEDYLGWTLPFLEDFLKNNSITTALFIPYAGVRVGNPQTLKESYDNLFGRAQGVFEKFNVELA
ncbi:MAG: Type 1 glutamine amidotransferase-like domain-containing protein, partial [Bacteroidales bacterium]|nr:Type 1 glutamine amidotransferase-like domain-containing protein [Bacteroidales bacterium]